LYNSIHIDIYRILFLHTLMLSSPSGLRQAFVVVSLLIPNPHTPYAIHLMTQYASLLQNCLVSATVRMWAMRLPPGSFDIAERYGTAQSHVHGALPRDTASKPGQLRRYSRATVSQTRRYMQGTEASRGD
jgi:hypothetical protein